VIDLSAGDMPAIVDAVVRGEDESAEQLLAQAYSELRETARGLLRRERPGHTLQPTALVHEAFLLLGKQRVKWKNRAHFCAVAAMAMRRILVKYALRRSAAKRGGSRTVVLLDAAMAWYEERCVDLLALNEAMKRLAALDPQQSRIVEMRFFGGLTVEEISELLGASPRTIHREWNTARAWLRGQILNGGYDDGDEC
jgi:RNA polymerase sigma-70 factor, ECF subfamily